MADCESRFTCQLDYRCEKAPVLIVTSKDAAFRKLKKAEQIKAKGAEILVAPSKNGKLNLVSVVEFLSRRQIRQLLVEGGPTVITSFMRAGLADEIVIYITQKILADDGFASITRPMAKAINQANLYNPDIENFNGDIRIRGFVKPPSKL